MQKTSGKQSSQETKRDLQASGGLSSSDAYYAEWLASQMEFLHNVLNTSSSSTPRHALQEQQYSAHAVISSNEQAATIPSASVQERLLNVYQQWQWLSQRQMRQAYSAELTTHQSADSLSTAKIADDTFNNIFGVARTYLSLLEFWLPLFHAVKQLPAEVSTKEQVRAFINKQEYEKVLNYAFEFLMPEAVQQFTREAYSVLHSLGATQTERARQIAMLLSDQTDILRRLTADSTGNHYEKLSSVLAAKPRLKALADKLLHSVDEYASAFAAFQQQIYTTGQSALEQLLHLLAEVAEADKRQHTVHTSDEEQALYSYDAFFRLWVRYNEDAYQQLFRTADFAVANRNVSVASVRLYATFQEMVELVLEDYPVVLRSQIDLLHKAVHDLKRDMREMLARS
jgi:hypothetical protein